MRKSVRFLLLFVLLMPMYADEKPRWIWTGVEVVGPEPLPPKDELVTLLPFRLGDPFSPYDSEGKMQRPVDKEAIIRRLSGTWSDLQFTVGGVLFSDKKAYLVVNVVDTTLPSAPARIFDLSEPPPEGLFALRQALEDRRRELFNQGVPPTESSDKGYLHFDEARCEELTAQLADQAPPFRQRLVQLMLRHENSATRASAAELLNWSGDHQENVDAVITAMSDPDETVRNNATRYLMAFTSSLKDPASRHRLLAALAVQMRQPSHADRNKALFALNSFLLDWPEDENVARQITELTVTRIARQSILPNVGAIAKLLLDRWHPKPP